MKGKEVRIGEEKGTSVFYNNTATSSIDKKTVPKTFAIEYFPDKYHERINSNVLCDKVRIVLIY